MFTSSRVWNSWSKVLDKHCAIQMESGLVFTFTAKLKARSISKVSSRALKSLSHFPSVLGKEGPNVF